MSDDAVAEFNTFQDEIQKKYEIIRPVLLKQITAKKRAMQMKLHENTISKYVRRFNEHGTIGLTDQRHGPNESSQWLTIDMKTEAFSLYNANPNFSYSEIAKIVSKIYNRNIDHKSIKRVILENEALLRRQKKTRG